MPSYTPTVGGTTQYDLGGDNAVGSRRFGVIRERVVGAQNSVSLALTQQWPPSSRIVHFEMANNTIYTPACPTNTGTTKCVTAIVSTSPTSLTATATTHNLYIHSIQATTGTAGPIAADTVTHGFIGPAAATNGVVLGNLVNTGTTPLPLYLVNYASSTGAVITTRYSVDTTATTNAFLFGTNTATSGTTAADFDVHIYFEQFQPAT